MDQLILFDYQQLDAETRIVVQQRTSEIKALMKRTAQDIIEIGEKLIDVKERLGHGYFGGWLEGEFDWNERMARRFMSVAETFKTDNLSDLNFAPSALYLLAAPSTPDEAREEAIARAQSGEAITHTKAKEIVAEHRPAPQTSPQASFESTGPALVMEIVDEAKIVDEAVAELRQKLGGLDASLLKPVEVLEAEAEPMPAWMQATEEATDDAETTTQTLPGEPENDLRPPLPAAVPVAAVAPAIAPPLPGPPLPPPPVVREAAWVLSISVPAGAPPLVTILHGALPKSALPADVAERVCAAIKAKVELERAVEAEAEASEWLEVSQ
jgi:hypothetical protein